MNFEEAYQKLRDGTATDEEAAFVARELENVRKISAILDDPGLSSPGIGQAEADTYSARPGCSEHQTGLAVDVAVRGHSYGEFDGLPEGESIKEMAPTKPNFKIKADPDIADALGAIFADVDAAEGIVDTGGESYPQS